MTELIWVGNMLCPRWFVFVALGLISLSVIGSAYGLQVLVRRLLQRYGKNL